MGQGQGQGQATEPLCNRIAIVFDFDDTLAPDTLDSFLESCGVDPEAFERERVRPLIADGWDPIPAKFFRLIEESRRRAAGDKITRERLAAFGRGLTPFAGAPAMFGRLRERARACDPEIEVEFYLVSSGLGEIARNSPIARHFRALFGCEFHYDEAGEIAFPKRIITHAEKTLYLELIATGVGDDGAAGRRPEVIRDLAVEELHVPFSQMIYVGDGASDIPVFALLDRRDGTAIGVRKPGLEGEWGRQSIASEDQRVANVASADYHEDSELLRSLTLAVEALCKRIGLSKLSVGE